ncbi:hypothetical protein, partial [Aeromonas caviae]|uniref:hypothetical protein n=1 Tax=Aeromonas caviae TaxID=648 RepID=UPI00403A4A9F
MADGLLIQPLIGNLPNIMAPEWFDGLKRAADTGCSIVFLHHQAAALGGALEAVEPLRGHDVGQVADQRLDQQAVS